MNSVNFTTVLPSWQQALAILRHLGPDALRQLEAARRIGCQKNLQSYPDWFVLFKGGSFSFIEIKALGDALRRIQWTFYAEPVRAGFGLLVAWLDKSGQILYLIYGGAEGPAQRIRLETFVQQLRRRWRQAAA